MMNRGDIETDYVKYLEKKGNTIADDFLSELSRDLGLKVPNKYQY